MGIRDHWTVVGVSLAGTMTVDAEGRAGPG